MTDYREINALQRDFHRAKRLAEFLLLMVGTEWTDWEDAFLHSIIEQVDQRIATKDDRALSTRQAEILVELRDESVLYERAEKFSIRALIRDCHGMRHLLDDGEAEFIKRHYDAGTTKLRRRQVKFLFHCARKALAVEPYQGWKESSFDAAA
jgi:hypothetical protein